MSEQRMPCKRGCVHTAVMSRFVLGNCIDVMARIPDNAIDFILTDPPYLVGFRDRQGRTIAGDKTDEGV